VFALERSEVVCEVVRPDTAVEWVVPVLGCDPEDKEKMGEGKRRPE
jgi:hypothetical protein